VRLERLATLVVDEAWETRIDLAMHCTVQFDTRSALGVCETAITNRLIDSIPNVDFE